MYCLVCINKHTLENEVYSRIVGYLRPTQNWNEGKREEFGNRVPFHIDSALRLFPKPDGLLESLETASDEALHNFEASLDRAVPASDGA